MNDQAWVEEHGRPCKIGTIPMVVQVHGSDWRRMARMVDDWIRIRYKPGGPWESVLLRRFDDDGYFMADR